VWHEILRIISGEYGGRSIKAPAGRNTRPTAQMAREALFGIIAGRVPGAVFLDLFSGSGAVGIEAMSRGASAAVFADSDQACCRIAQENLAGLCPERKPNAAVVRADAMDARALRRKIALGMRLVGAGEIGIAFADPPYALKGIERLPGIIASLGAFSDDGVIVVEHSRQTSLPDSAAADSGPGAGSADGARARAFAKFDVRCYGQAAFTFYRRA
jgi:16S rRNA (guanine966-N2)-methyltransferase